MRRRVTEPQLARITLAAYRKFLLVAAGSGAGLLLLERAMTSTAPTGLDASGYEGNVLLIEVDDPYDAATRSRLLAVIGPPASDEPEFAGEP